MDKGNITAILKYNLDDSDANLEYQRMLKSDNAFSSLWDIIQLLRTAKKYGIDEDGKHRELSDIEYNIYDKIHEDILEILQDNDINLDKLYY